MSVKRKVGFKLPRKKIKISFEISEIYLLPDFGGRIEVENIIWPYQVSNVVDIFRINIKVQDFNCKWTCCNCE